MVGCNGFRKSHDSDSINPQIEKMCDDMQLFLILMQNKPNKFAAHYLSRRVCVGELVRGFSLRITDALYLIVLDGL